MKFHPLFSFFCILCHTFIVKVRSQENFTAVTSFSELKELYVKLQDKESHREPLADMSVDAEARKRICQSVTKSGFFKMDNREPIVEMGLIHNDLLSEAKYEEMQPSPIIYFQKVLDAYEKSRYNRRIFTYRTSSIKFDAGSAQVQDFAFPCLVTHRTLNGIAIYYISDPYNINNALDVPTDGQIYARFVCLAMYTCEVVAIAEEPAIAFANPKFSIEDIYLQMRKFYERAPTSSDDPLCVLGKSEKLRVCASVMNSSYFVGKIEFFPDTESVNETCELKTVSFETDDAKEKAKDIYEEWMFSCSVVPTVGSASHMYFVSRAYRSHHVVVYSWNSSTSAYYIENISGKTSVVVEKNLMVREQCRELSPPNLADLLRRLRKIQRSERSLKAAESSRGQ